MSRILLAVFVSTVLLAQPQAQRPNVPQQGPQPASATAPEKPEEKPVVTSHQIAVGGNSIKYTVTTGLMPIRNAETGELEANMFYAAYTADRPEGSRRALTFAFNGGPGSGSLWLHLGALSPKRVKMQDDGAMPAPPYELVDNEHTWLDLTDLVFIDPVGTGFSRATKPDVGKKFFGLRGDIQSVGEFIRLYLTRYERWNSPLFLAGESYGTTRASGLSGYLIDQGIAFNGIILISTVMNFETLSFTKGNDLPYILYLPTYTATAWYHKRLSGDLQRLLTDAKKWAETGYAEALAKGSRLTPQERQATIDQLARFTGLDKRYIDDNDLRIEIMHFTKELLRDHKLTVGRLDSRLKGTDLLNASERPDFDPSMSAIRPPYTAALNHYVRTVLGYKTDLTYYALGGGIGPWDWGAGNSFADTSEALRSAFAKNPYMKLFVGMGHYDLATPYFATEYTLTHMGLHPSLLGNIRTKEYESGHMFYIHKESLAKFKQDIAQFYKDALPGR